MKSTLFLVAAGSAVLVAAQNLTGEPDCAIPCLSTAIAAVCTPASDQGCACASQAAIGQAAIPCLLSGCDASALAQAQTAGAQLCVDYSATATGVVASSTASSNATGNMTTSMTGTSSSGASASATGSGSRSGASTTGSTATRSATATGSSASSTSSAGAQGGNGVVAVQAGLLGAVLAGVAALL